MYLKFSVTKVLLLAAFLFACKEIEEPAPLPDLTGVFIGGFEHGNPIYWKNDISHPVAGVKNLASIEGMFVSGADVYLAGNINVPNSIKTIPAYFKNEQLIELPFGNVSAQAIGIAVLNKDVHVIGYETDGISVFNAKYWLNNVEVPLITDKSKISFFYSIFVSGNDIYILGSENGITKYWKNKAVTELKTSQDFLPNSIFVVNQDVFISGFTTKGIAICKNGIQTEFTDGSTLSYPQSLFVSGSDVYISGYEYSTSNYPIAKYWKNGVGINLTDGSKPSAANAITVSGSDVYVVGYENSPQEKSYHVATYWKNGKAHSLSLPYKYSYATSIVVKK